jgi:hypothetical protein
MAYELRLQGDGNLVLYRIADWKPLWWSKTEGRLISAVTMQLDGNLVMYGAGEAVWSSNTYGGPDVSHLVLQDDGNVVIYRQGPAAWSTGT